MKNKLFLCALASGMLAITGCSDSTDLGQSGGTGASWNADGTGYVSLAINLPQANNSGSRASLNDIKNSDNDQFNDGKAEEYAVDDAILVLFTGTTDVATESDYKFAAAYNLPLKFNTHKPADDQITSTAKITKKIASIESQNIKALVILNPTSAGLKCDNPVDLNDTTSNKLKIGETEFTGKFGDFCKETASMNTDLKKGKFMMTNAPLASTASNVAGKDRAKNTVTTLANLKVENIKKTAKEANQAPAAEIFVERSVAKVSMSTKGFVAQIPYTTDGAPKITCSILGYTLDNTNSKSYIVRNTTGYEGDNNWYTLISEGVVNKTTGHRFIGNAAVDSVEAVISGGDKTAGYRTYFAKDVNFDKDVDKEGEEKLTTLEATADLTKVIWEKTENSLYCLENTFDVERQTHKNTTRALIKAKFTVDGINSETGKADKDLYMYNNDPKTLCDVDSLRKLISKLLESREEINTIEMHKSQTGNPTVKPEDLIIGADEKNPGYVKLTQFTVTNINGETIVVNSEASADSKAGQLYKLISKLGLDKIAKYTQGVGYYTVLIKHFGDELTPWNTWESNTSGAYVPKAGYPYYAANATAEDKAKATANYLGRYGVLRNNWYNLNVTGVNRIGTPNVPVPGDEWDDDMESYISVRINILSWAVRNQEVTLQ